MPKPPNPARTTSYGTDKNQVYDVRLPPPDAQSGSNATVVVVHGGFWRARTDREHAAPQAQALADAGHHVAVVEYRRTDMPGGGWPGTFDDVTAAIAAVHDDPDLPERLVLIGHSAGGHLVTLAAGQAWATERLAGAVSLAGVVDLALGHRLALGAGAVAAFLGSHLDQITEADPALHPPHVPVSLVHGDRDDVVPLSLSESYRLAVADRTEHEVRLHAVPAEHMDVIDPAHPSFATAAEEVARIARG